MSESGIYTEDRKMVFKNGVDFLQLPTMYDLKIKIKSTPDISNIHILIPQSVVNTITNFVGGSNNQMLRILGDGIIIISNNAFIKTNTGVNKTLLTNKVYTFHYINNIWYESA